MKWVKRSTASQARSDAEGTADAASLGRVLVDKGWICQKQLQAALKRQSSVSGSFGETLRQLGTIDEQQLAFAQARQKIRCHDAAGCDAAMAFADKAAAASRILASALDAIAKQARKLGKEGRNPC